MTLAAKSPLVLLDSARAFPRERRRNPGKLSEAIFAMERPVLLLLMFLGFCAPLDLTVKMCSDYHNKFDPDPECATGSYIPDTSPFEDPLYMHDCVQTKPSRRTQGFKRPDRCIPGAVEGTCLIPVYEKKRLEEAAETCLFDYGGRLAVANDVDTNRLWLQAIWRDSKYVGVEASQPSRFWLGALVNANGSADRFFSITDHRSLRFLPGEQWNHTLKDTKSLPTHLWPLVKERLPDNPYKSGYCPTWGVALDVTPSDGKWHVVDNTERHGFLCEAPRWPKLDCGPGWSLTPETRMCVKVVVGEFTFFDCIKECAKIGGMLLAESHPLRYYHKDAVEPTFKETGRHAFMGTHQNRNCPGKNRFYNMENLDGSVNGYVGRARVTQTYDPWCNNMLSLTLVLDANPKWKRNCFCQKVVDISAVEVAAA